MGAEDAGVGLEEGEPAVTLVVAQAQDRVAEVVEAGVDLGVVLALLGLVVGWAVDEDGQVVGPVEEVRPGVAVLDQLLGVGRQGQVVRIEQVEELLSSSFESHWLR